VTTSGNIEIELTGIIPMNLGGSNANLTASLGGMIYSTASAMAVLAGTSTGAQMLQSGASAAPTWSTSVWPATTTINQLLFSSANNVVGGVTVVNSAGLLTNGSGVPGWVAYTGTGAPVLGTGPTLSAPILGTPASGTLTNCTGLPLGTGVTGNLSVNNLNGGTSASSSTFWRGDGTWATVSTASGANTSKTITATNTFTAPQFVYPSGSGYALTDASSAATAECTGVVTAVGLSGSQFTVIGTGYCDSTVGFTSLAAGTVYWANPAAPGGMTSIQPTTIGQVQKPVFLADSANSGWLLNYRGNIITGAQAYGAPQETILTGATSGTYTVPVGTLYLTVEGWGAGGGGGGSNSAAGSFSAAACGGGGGGYFFKKITTAIASTYSYAVGSGGAAGAAGNNNGSPGSASTTFGSSFLTATVGTGGGAGASSNASGVFSGNAGTGGAGTGGDVNISGGAGGIGLYLQGATGQTLSGYGGSSAQVPEAAGIFETGAGTAACGPGGGGSGGAGVSGSNFGGGAGGTGVLIITAYFQ
jgi:hypothetical protein